MKQHEKDVQAVKANAAKYVEAGLSADSFTFGVLNIAFTAFLLGSKPEFFWIWQLAKCSVLLPLVFARRRTVGKHLYLIEFCWVVNLLSLLFGVAFALAPHSALLHAFVNRPGSFIAIFGIANGPLGWSIVALGNALVFHDIDNTATVYIHMSPAIMTWSFRWFAPRVAAAFPAHFNMLTLHQVAAVGAKDLVMSAGAVYACWFVPYVLYMCTAGVKNSPETTGLDTVWRWTILNNKAVRKVMGVAPTPEACEEAAASGAMALKYSVLQFAVSLLAMAATSLMWHSFWVHTAFLLLLLVSALRAGAKRYVNMMTTYMIKSVENTAATSKLE